MACSGGGERGVRGGERREANDMGTCTLLMLRSGGGGGRGRVGEAEGTGRFGEGRGGLSGSGLFLLVREDNGTVSSVG